MAHFTRFLLAVLVLSSSAFCFGVGIRGGLSWHAYTNKFTLPGGEESVIKSKLSMYPTGALLVQMRKKHLAQTISLSFLRAGGNTNTVITDELGVETGTGLLHTQLNYLAGGYSLGFRPNWPFHPLASLGLRLEYLAKRKEFLKVGDEITEFPISNDGAVWVNIATPIELGVGTSIGKISFSFAYTLLPHLLPYVWSSQSANSTGLYHTTIGHLINLDAIYDIPAKEKTKKKKRRRR